MSVGNCAVKKSHQFCCEGKVVQQSYTGLDRPLGLLEFEAPRISIQSAHEGGKVVSPTHRPPLPPKRYSWYSFHLIVPGLVDLCHTDIFSTGRIVLGFC